ncbi:MAG: NAD(P)/FAD-dependent oxidoreductase [Bacilli bacterium]
MPNVTVVGGGIVGLFTALILSEKSNNITLFEKAKVGSGTTYAAAGLLGAQAEWSEWDHLYDFAVQSRTLWDNWYNTLSDVEKNTVRYRRKGIYKLAFHENEIQHLHDEKNWQEQSYWSEKEMLPNHVSEDVKAVLLQTFDGFVNPREAVQLLVGQLKKRGVQIREQCEVTHVAVAENEITLTTTEGKHPTDKIIFCAGVDSNTWLSLFDRTEQIIPVQGCCGLVEHEALELIDPIFYNGCYAVPRGPGKVLIGATKSEGNWNNSVTENDKEQLQQTFQHFFPELSGESWTEVWSGLRPKPTSHFPILRRDDRYENVFWNCGHWRNGILLAPICAQIIAEIIEEKQQFDWERGVHAFENCY